MNEYWGIIILFTILATLLVWIFVKPETSFKLKLIMIPLVLWYGIALYWFPINLSGRAKNGEPPDGSIVISGYIIESRDKTEEGLYLWVIEPITEKEKLTLNPKEFFAYLNSKSPRSYRIELTEELLKQYLNKQKEKNEDSKEKRGGGVLIYRRHADERFRLLSPEELLPKGKN